MNCVADFCVSFLCIVFWRSLFTAVRCRRSEFGFPMIPSWAERAIWILEFGVQCFNAEDIK